MQPEQALRFGPYQLDPRTGQLWRGTQEVKVTPKAAAVLCAVVKQAGQVVTKEELFCVVWPDTVVSDAALTTCIQELRHALRDHARRPRYIETVHRRGFRFIAPLATTSQGSGSRDQGSGFSSQPSPNPRSPNPTLVGREAELAQLHGWLEKALNGERQIVFVTGEPGIGKTTLIESFLFGVRSLTSHEENQAGQTLQ